MAHDQSLYLDTAGLSFCSVANPPFMDRCHFMSLPHPPSPPCVLTSLLPEINVEAAESWAKKEKKNWYQSLSTGNSHTKHILIFLIVHCFVRKEPHSRECASRITWLDFEHHFLTAAPSVSAVWWKAGRGEKNQFRSQTGKDELFSSERKRRWAIKPLMIQKVEKRITNKWARFAAFQQPS